VDARSELTIIALGSNLGSSRELIHSALQALQELSAAPIRASRIYETAPVDCPPGSPDFLNAVAIIKPLADETPETLLAKLQGLEKAFGRQAKKVMNEARPLDLDLIAFGNERRASADLTLPHPRAHLRKFVLEPLAELAPNYALPGQTRTVRELLAELP